MIKLIGIDVDGTLLNSRGKIPTANLEAITEAVDRGIQVAIVTGRSFSFALPAVAPLPEPLILVVHNGAIARTRAGDTLARRLMPRAQARDVLAATMPWRDCAVVLFDRVLERQMVYDRMDWTHPNRKRFHERNLPILEEVAALEDALTEYTDRDFSLVDVFGAGVTKGSGLADLAASLGIDRSEVLAVGDNFNDREMLAWAGTGILMGNAAAEMRGFGFELTGTNDDAGLAQAIYRFALR